MQLINSEEISKYLSQLNGWFYIDKSIEKEFTLKSFADALAFVVKVGLEAEKIEHHPDMLLHSWNKVRIILSTNSAGGVTENDFKLAQTIDEIRK
ncbi:MAG: 4a-hydroxytetrahydrobiopterin dehydratase [Bacteroidetes bacterium]|nr:4a-hydroxytetrahydrobiopterin dehydratase [Bacteroidota bacterium]MCL6098645.1 4a-hydroxytetrahydrobiopterin dehydratase [Bacteroidota bacterium]